MLKKTLASLALAGFVIGCGGAETKKGGTTPAPKASAPAAKPAEAKAPEKKADAPAPPKEEKKAEAPKTEEKKK